MNQAIALLLLQLAAFWPVWNWYVARLTTSNNENQWGLLAAVTALVFLWQERKLLIAPNVLLIPILLTILYAATFHFLPPLLRAIIAFITIGFTLSQLFCGKSLRPALGGLLLLALPIVPLLQFYLGYPLRVVVGAITAPLLQLSGLAVIREGTCLNWNGQLISIDAPCSGIKMLWAGFFLTFVLACIYRLTVAQTLLASVSALLLLIAGNILRASALFYIEAKIIEVPLHLHPDWAHAGIGVSTFLLTALGLVWSVQQIRSWKFIDSENVCEAPQFSSLPVS